MPNLLNKATLPLPDPGQVTAPAWTRPRLVRLTPGSPAHLRARAALAQADQKPVSQ